MYRNYVQHLYTFFLCASMRIEKEVFKPFPVWKSFFFFFAAPSFSVCGSISDFLGCNCSLLKTHHHFHLEVGPSTYLGTGIMSNFSRASTSSGVSASFSHPLSLLSLEWLKYSALGLESVSAEVSVR